MVGMVGRTRHHVIIVAEKLPLVGLNPEKIRVNDQARREATNPNSAATFDSLHHEYKYKHH